MPFRAPMRWFPKECCVQVIKVDSYGVCEQNMQQPDANKDDVLPLAHFTLAFENSQVLTLTSIAAVHAVCRATRPVRAAYSVFSRALVLCALICQEIWRPLEASSYPAVKLLAHLRRTHCTVNMTGTLCKAECSLPAERREVSRGCADLGDGTDCHGGHAGR